MSYFKDCFKSTCLSSHSNSEAHIAQLMRQYGKSLTENV